LSYGCVTKEVIEQRKRELEAKGERTSFEKVAVAFGMIERDGRIVIKKIGNHSKNANREVILPLLKKYIANGSILITDESSIYDEINFLEHLTVNHKKCYVTKEGVHSNSIENVWKHLRKVLQGTYFHVSYEHFDRYLNENTYRWNRRKETEKVLFEDFMPLLVGKSVSYEKLTNRSSNKLAA